MKKILYFIFLLLLFSSCQEILFNDNEQKKELLLENFNVVRIFGLYNIVLIQDSTDRVVINGKNDVNSITAVVINDTLTIDDHKNLSFNPNKNTLFLHFKDLKYLITYDPVNVLNLDTIKVLNFLFDAIGEIAEVKLVIDCDYFQLHNSANTLGHFYISGKSNSCMFFNRYGCSIYADSLFCKNGKIINESVGDVYVNVSERLYIFIWGPGNIYYYGTPQIDLVEKKDKGKVIPIVHR